MYNMNRDIIFNISKHLNINDIFNFMRTNKYTYDSLNIDIIWESQFNIFDKKYDLSFFNKYSHKINYKNSCKNIIMIENLINLKYIKRKYNFNELINLQQLYLYDNKITQIPIEIGQLINLRQLDLYNNQITQIPIEIGQLINLQQLYLYNNQISQIPIEIGQLINLHKLSLSNNQITQIPIEIRNMANYNILKFI